MPNRTLTLDATPRLPRRAYQDDVEASPRTAGARRRRAVADERVVDRGHRPQSRLRREPRTERRHPRRELRPRLPALRARDASCAGRDSPRACSCRFGPTRGTQEPNDVALGIAEVMARIARVGAIEIVPIREVEPITLNAARDVQRFLEREHIRSVIVVTPLFRSRRSALVYGATLGRAGIAVRLRARPRVAGSGHLDPKLARHPGRGGAVAQTAVLPPVRPAVPLESARGRVRILGRRGWTTLPTKVRGQLPRGYERANLLDAPVAWSFEIAHGEAVRLEGLVELPRSRSGVPARLKTRQDPRDPGEVDPVVAGVGAGARGQGQFAARNGFTGRFRRVHESGSSGRFDRH